MKILQISNHANTGGSEYSTFNHVFKILSINYVVKHYYNIMRFEKIIAIFQKVGESLQIKELELEEARKIDMHNFIM